MATIMIEEPIKRSKTPPAGFALFALGFRPFYLLAAILALLFVPLWLATLLAQWPIAPVFPAVIWHGHEMVFGFAVAVVVGFLLTAMPKWTGQETPTGWPLGLFTALWLGARLSLLFGPDWLAAVLDLSFLPVVAALLTRLLYRSRNRRNYFVPVLLMGLAGANFLVHAASNPALAWFPAQWPNLRVFVSPMIGLHLAVALISTLTTVIAGRIVPSFTANAMKVQPWRDERLDRIAITFSTLALIAWAMEFSAVLVAGFAVIAAGLQIVRCAGWRPLSTLRSPLLWILHISHAWIIVALLLLAVQPLWPAAGLVVLHVLTVGVIGGLILGMITRTALGHTGRMLVAGRFELIAYVLLHIAVLARVVPLLVWPANYLQGLWLAGGAWALAFALYLWRYAPMLLKPRVDGRPG